jgi:hypothetical protein
MRNMKSENLALFLISAFTNPAEIQKVIFRINVRVLPISSNVEAEKAAKEIISYTLVKGTRLNRNKTLELLLRIRPKDQDSGATAVLKLSEQGCVLQAAHNWFLGGCASGT